MSQKIPTREEMIDVIKKMCDGRVKTKNGPFENIRETHGKNRHPQLDKLIKRQGGSLGDAYCQWGQQELLDELADYYGVSRKSVAIPEGGGTQNVFKRVPDRFKGIERRYPSWITWRNGNTGLGHVESPLEDISKDWFLCFGFNTNVDGDDSVARDGQGCGYTKRNHDPSGSLFPLGYTYIYEAIVEAMTGVKAVEPEVSTNRIGTYSWDTEIVQVKLVALGFNPGPIDGVLGLRTTAAVKAFQLKHLPGSQGSGVIGPKTRAKMDELLKSTGEGKVTPVIQDQVPSVLAGLQEGTLPWYQKAWEIMEFDPGTESRIASAAGRISKNFSRYDKVAKAVGFEDFEINGKMYPAAWVIGALHQKEASGSFLGVLHNGEKIIGTGKKTKLVPAGRGPFTTWEEAAIDAINLNPSRWKFLKAKGARIEHVLYGAERYNGTGYIDGKKTDVVDGKTYYAKDETSVYLWSCTNINDDFGKYTYDGVYNAKAGTNENPGVAPMISHLAKTS